MALQTLSDKILSRIYGHGRGWVFSSKDFADLGSLNTLGLSTQVPATWEYLSDGPSREYSWEGGQLTFIHRTAKDTALREARYTSAWIYEAIKRIARGKEVAGDSIETA